MYSHFDFFFFSSRRRHTRCSRDWSSDVCSSDLGDGRVPEFTASGMSSFFFSLPGLDAFAFGKKQMRLNLLPQFRIALLPPPEGPFHGAFSFWAGSRIPAIAAVSRRHRERSDINCRFPALVR